MCTTQVAVQRLEIFAPSAPNYLNVGGDVDDVDEDDDDDEELHAQSLQAHILPSRVITSLQDSARCPTQI